jgi:hypothetical protein
MVRLAFTDMLLMWLLQLKSELNVTLSHQMPDYSLMIASSIV